MRNITAFIASMISLLMLFITAHASPINTSSSPTKKTGSVSAELVLLKGTMINGEAYNLRNLRIKGTVSENGDFQQTQGTKTCFNYNKQINCFENTKISLIPSFKRTSAGQLVWPVDTANTTLYICTTKGSCFDPEYVGGLFIAHNQQTDKLSYKYYLASPAAGENGGLSIWLPFKLQYDKN